MVDKDASIRHFGSKYQTAGFRFRQEVQVKIKMKERHKNSEWAIMHVSSFDKIVDIFEVDIMTSISILIAIKTPFGLSFFSINIKLKKKWKLDL